jgi:Ni,Fe-hydrogenase III large subunit
MIAYLSGKLLEKQPGIVIVDVAGVGYEVSIPLSTFYELGDAGSDVSLRIYTHVREDAIQLYGFKTLRERDLFLQFFEKTTGLRMNHNYIRPGGVAVDLPDGWRDDLASILALLPDRLEEYDTLMTGQPIRRERTQGIGAISPEEYEAKKQDLLGRL